MPDDERERLARRRGTKLTRGEGAAPGEDNPRWQNAPEDGPTYFVCQVCDQESLLCYRCSECGAPADQSGGQATSGSRT
jgi:hypothetical protein